MFDLSSIFSFNQCVNISTTGFEIMTKQLSKDIQSHFIFALPDTLYSWHL